MDIDRDFSDLRSPDQGGKAGVGEDELGDWD